MNLEILKDDYAYMMWLAQQAEVYRDIDGKVSKNYISELIRYLDQKKKSVEKRISADLEDKRKSKVAE